MFSKDPHRLGLVLSGGGARGAYEAGVINYIRTKILPEQGGHRTFEVQCGSSVGAINTCFMASYAHDPLEQGRKIWELWSNLRQENIYKRNMAALMTLLGRSVRGMSANFLAVNPFDIGKRRSGGSRFRYFLDTKPLLEHLQSHVSFYRIAKNIKERRLAAVSVTATNTSNDKMELFIQKRPDVAYTGDYIHQLTNITARHVLASAAIPIVFPAVNIHNTYYCDGGLRLNTPMSPAIQLGADKIVIIGVHHKYRSGERFMHVAPPNEFPTLGQQVGLIMTAMFSDRIQYDMEQLTRINRLIEWSERVFGNDYLSKINKMLVSEGLSGDIAERGLKKIHVLQIFPSQDISALFSECYQKHSTSETFTTFEKVLFRLLDIDPSAGVDILSYLSFMPHYLKTLLELGFHDAESKRDEIIEFLSA
jgi:NTE family protein